jgi:microtubule-associated protein, RP/EB family
MKAEDKSLKEAVMEQEKEREGDFSFHKLRDIELLLQTAVENDPPAAIEKDEDGLVKNI